MEKKIKSVTPFSRLEGEKRSKIVKRHIALGAIYKILAVGLSFIVVPLTINYLTIEEYGIWMTLLSVISWFTFFDIGLGHGLRNKLAEAVTIEDMRLAKTYISTAYFAIILISILLFVIFVVVLPFLSLEKIFNTKSVSNTELLGLVLSVFFFFSVNFILSLCKQIFYAYQKASLVAFQQVLFSLISLIGVLILIRYTTGRLFYLSIIYGSAMLLSNLILTYFFFKKHEEIKPSINSIDIRKIKEIISLGGKFFVIQIAVVIIFSTDSMIIIQVLGPSEVTSYNIVYKLFSIITIGHSIIMAPLWSAFTQAYVKKDNKWIQSVLKKLNMLMIPVLIAVLFLIYFSRDIVDFWVGPEVKFDFLLALLMGIYIVISIWNNNFSYILGGISKVRLGTVYTVFTSAINIPISIYFARKMGVSGVILGTICSIGISAILSPIQVWYFIFTKKRTLLLDRLLS